MIIIPDKLRRPAEVERDELRKHLAEVRAEIDYLERIVDEMTEEQAALCAVDQNITELVAEKNKQLTEARAEIEKNSKLIERMKNCQNCGRTGGFCRHCRYAPDKRGWDDNWKEPI